MTIQKWLLKEGFAQGDNDPCVFIKKGIKVVLYYVDDIIVRATKTETAKFYQRLTKKFKAKDQNI